LPFSTVEIASFTVILAVLCFLAYRIRALDRAGTITGGLVGWVTFYVGGLQWFIALIFFFLVSSILTKYRYDEKRSLGYAQDKKGARGWRNVLANGGISLVFALNELVIGGDIYTVAFLGSVAAAFSDTLGTEVGLLSKSDPRHILPPFRKAVPGESGAVSALGLIASFAGAISVGILSVAMGLTSGSPFSLVFAVMVGGFAGAIFDSVLGLTVQGGGECVVCGKQTESLNHHGKPTRHLKGIRVFENNIVNFVSTALGAVVTASIFAIL
jgi:uncharacterized protein (TIGR00297 family)